MTVGVLILNHNGAHWLAPLYASLSDQTFENIRIYLVDNDSADDSIQLTRERFPEVHVIKMPKNLGYSMAYNAAIPIAFADGCDLVILANNDIKLEGDCIRELERIARTDERIGIIGPAFLDWSTDKPNYYMLGAHPLAIDAMTRHSPEPIAVDWVEGSFMMVSRHCFETVGPLDPIYLFYWEEVDYCRRARYQGWRVVLAPAAIARHYAGGTSEISPRHEEFARLKARNEYLFNMTDPTRSWLGNCLHLAHLVGVKTKQALFEGGDLRTEMAALFDTIVRIGDIRKKWRRDQSRVAAPQFVEAEASTRCAVFPAEAERKWP